MAPPQDYKLLHSFTMLKKSSQELLHGTIFSMDHPMTLRFKFVQIKSLES